jgi:AcrR family transcriptional regulator
MNDRPVVERRRGKLSRARILEAALRLADEDGIEAVSMRRIGQAMDVEAMSLYKHVAGKEDILDGISDLVMLEVDVPGRGVPWRTALRQSALSTHHALMRHPWASVVLESRADPGPARRVPTNASIGVAALAMLRILRVLDFDRQVVADFHRRFHSIFCHNVADLAKPELNVTGMV